MTGPENGIPIAQTEIESEYLSRELYSPNTAEHAIAFLDRLVGKRALEEKQNRGKIIREVTHPVQSEIEIKERQKTGSIDHVRIVRGVRGDIASAYVSGVLPKLPVNRRAQQWEASIMVNDSKNGPRVVLDTWTQYASYRPDGRIASALSDRRFRGWPHLSGSAWGFQHVVFGRDESVDPRDLDRLKGVLNSIEVGLQPHLGSYIP